MTFLRVFIRRCGDTVPGSNKRVLTRLQCGLLRAPTVSRPHVSLGDLLPSSQACQVPPFSFVLVDARSAAWWVQFFFVLYFPRFQSPAQKTLPRHTPCHRRLKLE